MSSVAGAAPAVVAPVAATVWLGTFEPAPAVEVSPTHEVVARAGVVTALTPVAGSPAPSGAIAVVQPLVGMNIAATLEHGHAKLALFAIDRRQYANSVLLVAATLDVRFVVPSAADVKAIRAALAKDDALSGVRRALNDLEVGAIDVDGDHKADYAITYGCTVWGDGECQVHGQFTLAKTHGVWHEME
ncbi:MAG: hypothetical protein ABI591_02825 [Kofleriaceae bacterium]